MELFYILVLLITLGVSYITLGLSRLFHLPEPIILFGIGYAASFFLPADYLTAAFPVLLICLLLLLFDAGSRFIPRHFTRNIMAIGEFVLLSLVINMLLSFIIIHVLFSISPSLFSIVLSIMCGSVLTACSQFEILSNFRIKHTLLYKVAEYENHLSNPISHIILSIGTAFILSQKIFSGYQIAQSFAGMFLIDIGVGIMLGMFLHAAYIKILKKNYIWISAIIFSNVVYWSSILLGGTGYLAVIVMSLFFHNVIAALPDLEEFTPALKDMIYVLIFLAMGFSWIFSVESVLFGISLCALYALTRYSLVQAFFIKELHMLSYDFPKGLSVGAFIVVSMIIFAHENILTPFLRNFFSGILLFFIVTILISYIFHISTRSMISDDVAIPSTLRELRK